MPSTKCLLYTGTSVVIVCTTGRYDLKNLLIIICYTFYSQNLFICAYPSAEFMYVNNLLHNILCFKVL